MKSVIVGHSWVKRLQAHDLLPPDFSFIGNGGATFPSLTRRISRLEPDHSVRAVFIFAGSNDLSNVKGTAGVNAVFESCLEFRVCLKRVFPRAIIVQSQVEDRYLYDHQCHPWELKLEFKRKSNKFNKWLLKNTAKNCLFILKGANGFSDPKLYDRDGNHLNAAGNAKLAEKIARFL